MVSIRLILADGIGCQLQTPVNDLVLVLLSSRFNSLFPSVPDYCWLLLAAPGIFSASGGDFELIPASEVEAEFSPATVGQGQFLPGAVFEHALEDLFEAGLVVHPQG